MGSYNVIFCVLTYKNHQDLQEFIDSLRTGKFNFSYRIVVVNNFADNKSLDLIKNIALSNNCDFIENDNLGYSHGNNLAIKYAKENYEYEYIIISNSDIIVKELDYNRLMKFDDAILAPEIICLNNKKQNPMYFRYMPVSEKIVYYGFILDSRLIQHFGILFNKIDRYLNRIFIKLIQKEDVPIYACHGSFIIFSKRALQKFSEVFDENIFLFCEESDLAQKARGLRIRIIYDKKIKIWHKEDGSMKLSKNNLYDIHKKSYLYYYKKWTHKGR
jgi:GT2 family glycosyltransferase